MENFNKEMKNHELSYTKIKRIYSTEKGYIKIELDECFSNFEFEVNGIKRIKLEKKFHQKTEDLID